MPYVMLMLQCLDRRMAGVRGLSREENQLNFWKTGPDSVSLCFFRLSNQPFEAPDLVQAHFYTLETCNSIINPSATSVSPSASSLVFCIKSECAQWCLQDQASGVYMFHIHVPHPTPIMTGWYQHSGQPLYLSVDVFCWGLRCSVYGQAE